jgi:hypothetical protein
MVSRCLAHSFADGPCSVRDFPSGPMLLLLVPVLVPVLLLSGMAWAWALRGRDGAGVGLGGIGSCSIEGTVLAGPDQTGATARFSDAEVMAWKTAECWLRPPRANEVEMRGRLCSLPAARQEAKSRKDKSTLHCMGVGWPGTQAWCRGEVLQRMHVIRRIRGTAALGAEPKRTLQVPVPRCPWH